MGQGPYTHRNRIEWAIQDSNTPAKPEEYANLDSRGAESGALSPDSVPTDPDLARLIRAWGTLPRAVRRDIIARIDAAQRTETTQ